MWRGGVIEGMGEYGGYPPWSDVEDTMQQEWMWRGRVVGMEGRMWKRYVEK